MKVSYIIKNGRVVDPARGIDEVRDIYIKNSWMVEPEGEVEITDPIHVIDAEGCIVTPGLIDFHVHCFHGGSSTTVLPDTMLSTGVTAAVDAGTAGSATYESYYNNEVTHSAVRLKGYLTPYAGGQLDVGLNENFDPATYNRDKIARLVDKYRDNIIALKIRLQHGVIPEGCAADYMKGMIELSEWLEEEVGVYLPVCVHTTDCPLPAGELSDILRPGDIYTHCFQGKDNPIVLEDGSVDPGVIKGRQRGVIYDCCRGKSNFDIEVTKAAFANGFFPDIISTDITIDKFHLAPYTKNLPTVASMYLSLGMDFTEVMRAMTETPAKLMGMEGKIGTLAPGAYADIAIFKLDENATAHHADIAGHTFVGNELLIPQMTFLGGDPVFSYTGFNV